MAFATEDTPVKVLALFVIIVPWVLVAGEIAEVPWKLCGIDESVFTVPGVEVAVEIEETPVKHLF